MDDAPLRCFVAFPVPEEVRAALLAACERLRREPWADAVRWVPGENLHLTLRFLGDVERGVLSSLCRALDRCATRVHPIPLQLGKVTGLPSGARARVLVASVEAPPSLAALVRELETALAREGYPPERRRFRPHITLGRVRRPPLPAGVSGPLAASPFVAGALRLVQSSLERSGARYQTLHCARLDAPLD